MTMMEWDMRGSWKLVFSSIAWYDDSMAAWAHSFESGEIMLHIGGISFSTQSFHRHSSLHIWLPHRSLDVMIVFYFSGGGTSWDGGWVMIT